MTKRLSLKLPKLVWCSLTVAMVGALAYVWQSAGIQKVEASSLSTTWSCTEQVAGGTRGRLYQSVSGGGSLSLYSFAGGESASWSLDLQGTYSLPAGKTINALSLTPSGEMYGVLQIDGGSPDREHQLVRIYPPPTVGGTGSYEIIGPYQYLSNTSKAVNAGAYIEIANEGFLLMARNGGGTNAALYNLGTGVWSDYNVSGQGTVKDITWLPEPVTYSGITYIAVGIEENNGNQSVLYAADGSATAVNTSLNGFSFDSSKGWGAAASYEASSSSSSSVLMARNDGILAEWEWNNGSPSLTSVGTAAATTDNDGASCGSTSLITTSVSSWSPAVGFNLACADDSLEITVVNSGSTIAGELLITKNGTELTWNVNGYPYIDPGDTQTWSATVVEAETNAVFQVTVTPPFGSGFDPVTDSFTYNADCVPVTVTLTYDAQGGVGEPGDQSGDAGSDVTVSSTVPTRDGYTFTGWNTAADGSGTGYSGGDAFTLPSSGSDTLYAQWQINSVTLTYDAQGGVGEPGDQSGDAGSDVTVSSTVPAQRWVHVYWLEHRS